MQKKYYILVLAAHGEETNEELVVDFYTNEKALVPQNMLFDIIKQFGSCACFYIELVITGTTNKNITAEVSKHNLTIHLHYNF